MSEPRGGLELVFELDIERPPEAVFDLIIDPGSFKRLDPAVIDFGPDQPMTEGAKGWFRHRRGGMVARTTYTVTTFDPARQLVVEIKGMGYEMTESATLAAAGAGTHARFEDRVWPTSLAGRMLVALSGGIMRRDLQARAARLRQILESGG